MILYLIVTYIMGGCMTDNFVGWLISPIRVPYKIGDILWKLESKMQTKQETHIKIKRQVDKKFERFDRATEYDGL